MPRMQCDYITTTYQSTLGSMFKSRKNQRKVSIRYFFLIFVHLISVTNSFNYTVVIFSAIPKRKPMAKLVYHLMTDRELKKRVAEAGLPTKGDRKVREQGKKTGSHAKVFGP